MGSPVSREIKSGNFSSPCRCGFKAELVSIQATANLAHKSPATWLCMMDSAISHEIRTVSFSFPCSSENNSDLHISPGLLQRTFAYNLFALQVHDRVHNMTV